MPRRPPPPAPSVTSTDSDSSTNWMAGPPDAAVAAWLTGTQRRPAESGPVAGGAWLGAVVPTVPAGVLAPASGLAPVLAGPGALGHDVMPYGHAGGAAESRGAAFTAATPDDFVRGPVPPEAMPGPVQAASPERAAAPPTPPPHRASSVDSSAPVAQKGEARAALKKFSQLAHFKSIVGLGAGIGALLGSALPGVGTIAGAVLGAVWGAIVAGIVGAVRSARQKSEQSAQAGVKKMFDDVLGRSEEPGFEKQLRHTAELFAQSPFNASARLAISKHLEDHAKNEVRDPDRAQLLQQCADIVATPGTATTVSTRKALALMTTEAQKTPQETPAAEAGAAQARFRPMGRDSLAAANAITTPDASEFSQRWHRDSQIPTHIANWPYNNLGAHGAEANEALPAARHANPVFPVQGSAAAARPAGQPHYQENRFNPLGGYDALSPSWNMPQSAVHGASPVNSGQARPALGT